MRPAPGPTVSVIIPTHNRADLLLEGLKGVAAQTYEDYEVLIVNDHPPSGDIVGQVVTRFDDRFRIVANETSLGPAGARNRGLAEAVGQVIAPLDDDDIWLPTYLERHIAAHRHQPQAAAVYSGYLADGTELALGTREVPALAPPPRLFQKMLAGRFTIASASIVTIKSAFLNNVGGYDPELFGLEDWDLLCRLAQAGPFVHIPEALALYREHPGARASRLQGEVLAKLESKWRAHPETGKMVRRVEAEALFRASRSAVLTGQPLLGARYLVRFLGRAGGTSRAGRLAATLVAINLLGGRGYAAVHRRLHRPPTRQESQRRSQAGTAWL